MNVTTSALLRAQAAQYKISEIFSSTPALDVPPMMPVEALAQNECFLSLKSGDDINKGLLTGALGGVGTPTALFAAVDFFISGNHGFVFELAIIAFAMLIIPFLWEVLSPVSPPTLFNRRTREVYFQHKGHLYHTPWGGIGAFAYEYTMVHQNIGAMTNSPLEILMHRFCKPDERIFVAVGLPMGKTLELQQHAWAYLQAYMDRGPWLDEHGNTTESPAHTQQLLKTSIRKRRNDIKDTWLRLKETRSGTHTLQMFIDLVFYPISVIWDITGNIARNRSQYNWPDEVLDRLKPDGPTSRLVDIDNEAAATATSQ